MLRKGLLALTAVFSFSLHAEVNPQYIETLDLSAGYNHVCAQTTAGVKCFGNAESVTTKVPSTLKNPRLLKTGNRFSCALVDDGIRCWGEIPNTTRTDVLINLNTFPKAKLLSVGFDHYCAVSETDKIKCWGSNEYGESTPPAELKNITELSLGMHNTCAIADNQVVCWGLSQAGSTTLPSTLLNPKNLTSGIWHHCVQTDEGLKCWGNPYKEFTSPDDSTLTNIQSGGLFNCGLSEAGVKCWDEKGKTTLIPNTVGATKLTVGTGVGCAFTETTGVICWKLSGKDMFAPMSSYVPAGGISTIENLSTGHGSTCAYGDGGKLKCWGANYDNALDVPSEIVGPITSLTVGAHRTCTLKDSAVECFGDSAPEYKTPSKLGPVSFVSSGGNHICAGTNEKVKCWGNNYRGALNIPAELTNITQVSAGMLHNCAVSNNEVTCWGGDGLIKDVNPPTKMINPKAICTGGTFSCGINEEGKVQCWGEQIPFNHMGVNRKQANEVLNVPTDITNATEISCGVSHGCAVYAGKIKCWGSGAYLPERLAPPKIENPRLLSAGWNHTCVVGDKGLSCWGKMVNIDMPNYSLVK